MKFKFINKKRFTLIAITLIVLVLAVYTSINLPDNISLQMFTKGVISVDLLKNDYVILYEGMFFYRTNNVNPLIDHFVDEGYDFIEQAGSGYIFLKDNEYFTISSRAVTRWHSIMLTK